MITVSYVNYDYCEEVAWGIVMTGWASGLPDINKKIPVQLLHHAVPNRTMNCRLLPGGLAPVIPSKLLLHVGMILEEKETQQHLRCNHHPDRCFARWGYG